MQNGIFFLTSKSSLFFINLSGHTPALSQIIVVGREEEKQTEEQPDRRLDRQKVKKTEEQTDRRSNKQKNKETD